jgi:uncharacterized protein YijF (DUF1287 family)
MSECKVWISMVDGGEVIMIDTSEVVMVSAKPLTGSTRPVDKASQMMELTIWLRGGAREILTCNGVCCDVVLRALGREVAP